MQSLKKIVVIGPESTGKSTLSQALALHYDTKWVPEYAREFLLAGGNQYGYDDLLTIAKGQIAGEDHIGLSLDGPGREEGIHGIRPALLFIDTDLYVMKVWCEFVFNRCHQWIIDQIVERKYDLYLLCNTDLSWTKDELREYPDLETRDKLFRMYKDILINQSTPWVEIKGIHEQRLELAIQAVDSFLR
jgi:NadR type nicotinamide-nucleotide adenylyltransferase